MSKETKRNITKMRNLKRSISSYNSCDEFKTQIYQRNISVPCGFNYNDTEDEAFVDDDVSAVHGQTMDKNVLECLLDANGAFTTIYKAIIQSKENFQPRLSDAVVLLPDLAYLLTDRKTDALQTVFVILTRIKHECSNLQQQNMNCVIKAIKNAMLILHADEQNQLDVDNIITQPRDVMAAVMIVHKYLTNLTQPTNSEHILY